VSAEREARLDTRGWAQRIETYRQEHGKALGADALHQAVAAADAKAAAEENEHRLFVRFAENEEGVWLDMCDSTGRAILITSESWEIRLTPPILFRRFPHQAPLPEPIRGGDLRLINPFLNLPDEDDLMMVQVWLVTSILGSIPRPALDLHGPKGSAKTFVAQLLRGVVDPSALGGQDISRKPDELAQLFDHNAVAVFDNVTTVNEWQSNMFCLATTGGGHAKRAHYTNDDDFFFAFKRTYIITGINIPTAASDLLDRLILIELSPPAARREEDELLREFEKVRPAILGGLLDTLVKASVLRRKFKIPGEATPRMADFARWGEATAQALGYEPKRFLNFYLRNIERQIEEVLTSDPVASAMLCLPEGEWIGTMAELKDYLESYNAKAASQKSWPSNAPALGKKLNTIKEALEKGGIKFERLPGKNPRRVCVTVAATGVKTEM
jgi:hypothetical protein